MKIIVYLFALFFALLTSKPVYAMHIAEGYLPPQWCIFWWLVSIPFIVAGIGAIKHNIKNDPESKMLLAFSGAFTFVLSAFKIPSMTGSCSHPTGIGFGAVIFGPTAMTVIGAVVLTFQALFLAHGGLTTLGANVFSMAIVGSYTAYGIFKLSLKYKLSQSMAIFFAAMLGDLMGYVSASCQLAVVFPSVNGGIITSLAKFINLFAVTQLPIAIIEGIVAVIIFKAVLNCNFKKLKQFNIITGES
jgi:cobalt/nickel transport system permease protein